MTVTTEKNNEVAGSRNFVIRLARMVVSTPGISPFHEALHRRFFFHGSRSADTVRLILLRVSSDIDP